MSAALTATAPRATLEEVVLAALVGARAGRAGGACPVCGGPVERTRDRDGRRSATCRSCHTTVEDLEPSGPQLRLVA